MSIPLPALQVRPPAQGEGPLEQYAKVMSLKGMMQNQEVQQMRLKQAKDEMAEEAAVKQAIQEAGGDIRKALPKIMQVAPLTGTKIQRSVVEWDQADNTAKKTIIDRHLAQMKGLGQLAGTVTDQPSYENAIRQGMQAGLLDESAAQRMLSTPYNPETMKGWQNQALTAQEQLQAQRQKLVDTETGRHNKAMEAKQTPDKTLSELELWQQQNPGKPISEYWREKGKFNLKTEPTVVVQTTDAEGRPVSKIVPKRAGAEYATQPTAATRTMSEAAPKVKGFIQRIRPLIAKQRQQLGPAAGRWSEFMTGKVGAPNPEFSKLRTDIGLLQTLLMRMHVGARGGVQLMDHFRNLIDSGRQSPENLEAALSEIEAYAEEISPQGGGKQGGGTPATGGIKIVRDASGRIVGIE